MKIRELIFFTMIFATLCFAEFKSGIIKFDGTFAAGIPVPIDFSELETDSLSVVVYPLEFTKEDFFFSGDTLRAPFGMIKLNLEDTASFWGEQIDLDSARLFYDSILNKGYTAANNDTINALPAPFPINFSAKIKTSEGYDAYLIGLNYFLGALDHYTYYWAYDTGTASGVNERLIKHGNFRPEKDNFNYNVKGQRETLLKKWNIRFKN